MIEFKLFNENRILAQSHFDDYMSGELTLDELIDLVDLKLIARKPELQMILKNKFMLATASEERGISEADVKKRISALLKKY